MKRLLALCAAFFCALAVTTPVSAREGPTAREEIPEGTAAAMATADVGAVAVVHAIPGVAVDVYIDGGLAIAGFAYPTVVPAAALAGGDRVVTIFAAEADAEANASDRGDAAILELTVPVTAGAAATVVAHLTADGIPVLAAYADDWTVTNARDGRVVVRHTAAAGPVDVVVNGDVLFDAVPNGAFGGIDVPAGVYDLEVRLDADDSVLLATPLVVRPGVSATLNAVVDPDLGVGVLQQTVLGLGLAPEYRLADGTSGQVARMYVAFMARSPEAGGFDFWNDQLTSGERDLREVARLFEASPEFQERFATVANGTDAQWVEFLYTEILGRPSEPGGKAYWMGRLADSTITRSETVVFFSESDEFKALTATN